MKKFSKIGYLVFIINYILVSIAFSQNNFTIQNKVTNVVQSNYHFQKSEEIALSAYKKPISGYSITGEVDLKNKNSLVRVILIDANNEEYLVYEAYPLITGLGISKFDNICEETYLLDNVLPIEMKVIVEDATLQINKIQVSDIVMKSKSNEAEKRNISLDQVAAKAHKINQSHAKNGGTWFAGVTDMALLPYKSKKVLFGGDDYNTRGFEYYVSGFFVDEDDSEEEIITNSNAKNSNYPSEFDWRNRHGIDWTTSVKHQDTGGGCWAFTAVGAVEILTNLYFNQKLDLDLSEQDVISCSGAGTNQYGGWPEPALGYIASNGVVNEECFPFANADLSCNEKCSNPSERIKIGGFTRILPRTEEKLKESIIFKGPLTSGYNTKWHHAMVLVGYGVIKEGDYIFKDTENWEGNGWVNTIQAGNPLIGKTYWIFKNSYGTNFWTNVPGTGYIYMVFKNLNNILSQNSSISLPITSLIYTEADRVCEDRDGDGYYNWGIGPKPSTCPTCAPEEPDGDDSNPNLGPMDEYGNYTVITPLCENISTSQTWNINRTLCRNITIQSGVTLTIAANTTIFSSLYTITINNGGKLIISGGTINDGNIIAQRGSEITILNNGKILLGNQDNLDMQLGSIFNLEHGEVGLK